MNEAEPAVDVGDDPIALKQRNEQLVVELRETRRNADQRLIQAMLKAAALRDGMIDLDGLKLAETTHLEVDTSGEVPGAAAVIGRLRRAKPWLFAGANSSSLTSPPATAEHRTKLATEMSLQEWRSARSDLVRRR
jgi:hypothetical protein